IFYYGEGALTMGQVLATTALAMQLAQPAVSLLSEWRSFTEIGVSFAKVDEIVTVAPEELNLGAQTVGKIADLCFKDVGFSYNREIGPYVLSGLDFSITSGEVVAIVGESGSGKTTAARMINLLHEPTEGDLLFNGLSYRNLNLLSLR